MSTLAWLDASEHERRRALEAIALLHPSEARDELGLGGIRDFISDLLAPGTSTLQTRARYFLFIPWMYQAMARRGVRPDEIARKGREAELRLMRALEANEDHAGNIGRQSGERLQRLPSNIYWQGLGRLRVRLFDGSQDRFHRAFGADTRDSLAEPDELNRVAWHPALPAPPDTFPERVDFALRKSDAEFLQDRLRQHAVGSLLVHLVDSDVDWDAAPFAWESRALADADPALTTLIEHARCFSEVMHGASLVYNLLLAEALGNGDWIAGYRAELAAWADVVDSRRAELRRWDQDAFWRLVRPASTSRAMRFCEEWSRLALSESNLPALPDAPAVRALVSAREIQLKGTRSRLRSRRHLDLWQGASGSSQLAFRWGVAQWMAQEIRLGLRQSV